jgi:hypothetical protein
MIRTVMVACVALLVVGGCMPDLVPGEHKTTFNLETVDNMTVSVCSVKLEVKNIGSGPSLKEVPVYFIANPTTLQQSANVPPLQSGASGWVMCRFDVRELHAKGAKTCEAIVDPKNAVKESNERNNNAEWNLFDEP